MTVVASALVHFKDTTHGHQNCGAIHETSAGPDTVTLTIDGDQFRANYRWTLQEAEAVHEVLSDLLGQA